MNSPQPPSPPSSAAAAADTKLRLMCRYGGQILSRPRSNSLYYLGGETRIVSVNRKTINDLSSFVSHLSSSFSIQFPFSIKYQLPSHDLDSLVSLSSDEDFHLMLDEQLRFSSSGRIRLFLFFSNPETKKIQNVIDHPKTEDWFVDVLKSAKKLQKAGDRVVDFDGETANDASGLAESMVLETSSSFGSSSSSASLSNVPPIKAQEEDGLVNLLGNIVKLPSSESITTLSSDSVNQTADCESKIGTHEEPNLQVCSDENFISASHFNLGNRQYIHDPSAKNPVHIVNELNFNMRSSQLYPGQESSMLFVPPGTHNVPQNLSTMFPISSYYPTQHQMPHYQQNHVYPFYFVPQVSQPCNIPIHYSLIDAPIAPSYQSQAHSHLNPPLILPQVTYEEANEIPSTRKPHFHKPYAECEHNIPPPQTCYFLESIEDSHNEVKSVISEFDGGLGNSQIYKSQPPPPVFPSRQQAKSEPPRI